MEGSEYIKKGSEFRRSPLANEVANKLVSYIHEQDFQPGDRIPSEFELADKFKVGRGTVREAVKLLVSRNVLEIRPAKGTFVCERPGLTADPLGLEFVQDKEKLTHDLLELRIVLESYVTRSAALRASDEQIAEMRKLADAIRDNADDNEFCIAKDIALHQYIAESCGNSVITTVLPIIRKSMEDFNSLSFERQWQTVNAGHYAIIDAIALHNPMLAESECVQHISYVSRKLRELKAKEKAEE